MAVFGRRRCLYSNLHFLRGCTHLGLTCTYLAVAFGCPQINKNPIRAELYLAALIRDDLPVAAGQ